MLTKIAASNMSELSVRSEIMVMFEAFDRAS
jgi:hypothetical protein